MRAIGPRVLQSQGRQAVAAYKAWSDHARDCDVCRPLAAYSRLPGRSSGSLNAAYTRLTPCESGQELWGAWRFEVDQLRSWFKDQ